MKVGIWINWSGESDLTYNININYPMDYLFGGTVHYLARLAANTASKNASNVVFENTKAKLNAAIAAGIPLSSLSGRRKKRLVAILFKDLFGSVSLLVVHVSTEKTSLFLYLGSNDKYSIFEIRKKDIRELK